MNKDNAHEYLPLVQALADGKTIQRRIYESDEWEDYDQVTSENYPHCYRVKPEPRTFEIVRSKLTKDIYSAENYDGGAPSMWEYITVMEVLQ